MREDQRGFALILTLVVTALLVAVAVEFIHGVYVDTSLHRNRVNLQQGSLMAQGGIAGGVAYLRQLRAAGKETELMGLLANPLVVEDEKGAVSVTVEEENGKLNLNAVTQPNGAPYDFNDRVERRLLRLLGLSPALHDTLADWVDTDDTPRPDGAESAWYRGLPSPYSSRNSRFETFGELGLVRGSSTTVMTKLRPCATVYGTGTTININTAPSPVLEALDDDMTQALARAIVERRRDRPFTSLGQLSEIPGMERIAGRLDPGWVGVKGSIYRLVATATVGEAQRIVEAVVTIDGAQPTYLYWREY
ncbi:MAG: general secretion pathway protein GspK [Desulfuromonadales bacterium]|nr:MAG: general secretion pathway protein GspK [Desulfuromonadales bacterium]